MKCKINGFWNSNGVGEDSNTHRQFAGIIFFSPVSYQDKKQSHMIGEKSKTLKVKATDLNNILGLGLTDAEVVNFTAEQFQKAYNVLGSTCIIDFDDDSKFN